MKTFEQLVNDTADECSNACDLTMLREIIASATEKATSMLTQALKDTIEDLQWCSGAEDFQIEGKARKGWLGVRKRMEVAMELLDSRVVWNGPELTSSEALYGFIAWVTTRREQVVASSKDDASVWARLVDEFCKINELAPPRDNYPDFFIMPPKED